MCVCVYVYVCVCMCVYKTLILQHTHTHTHTHTHKDTSRVARGNRILRQHLSRWINPSPKSPGYDNKPSDSEASVLEFGEYGVPLRCHYSQVQFDPEQ